MAWHVVCSRDRELFRQWRREKENSSDNKGANGRTLHTKKGRRGVRLQDSRWPSRNNRSAATLRILGELLIVFRSEGQTSCQWNGFALFCSIKYLENGVTRANVRCRTSRIFASLDKLPFFVISYKSAAPSNGNN